MRSWIRWYNCDIHCSYITRFEHIIFFHCVLKSKAIIIERSDQLLSLNVVIMIVYFNWPFEVNTASAPNDAQRWFDMMQCVEQLVTAKMLQQCEYFVVLTSLLCWQVLRHAGACSTRQVQISQQGKHTHRNTQIQTNLSAFANLHRFVSAHMRKL